MKKLRKLFSMLLALSVTMGLLSVTASAEETEAPAEAPVALTSVEWPDLQGEKTAKVADRESNLYDIKLTVPGADVDKTHDEVIIMVDGSYSGDSEWPAMKKGLTAIAEAVLDGKGNTQVTVMTFGMSPNIVDGMEHIITADQMTKRLPDLPGGLLRGVSSTNCEASFLGIQDYIENHDSDLRNAYVLYISDGGVNMDTTPMDWTVGVEKVKASAIAQIMLSELELVAYDMVEMSPESEDTYSDEEMVLIDAYIAAVEAYAEADEAKAEAEKDLADLKAEANEEVAALEEDKAAAEEELADLQQDLADAETELGELKAEEEVDEEAVADLETEIEEIKAGIVTKEDEIAAIEDEIEVAEAALAETEYPALIEAAEAALQEAVNAASAAKDAADEALAPVSAMVKGTDAETGKAKAHVWLMNLLKNVYEVGGMTVGEKYSINDVEVAYLDYCDENPDCYNSGIFYNVLASTGYGKDKYDGVYGTYAAAAAAEVAAMEEVAGMYMVRYKTDYRSDWMTDIEGTEFVQSKDISTLVSALEDTLSKLAKTPYNDVSVVDYMSEWVNLLPETVKIVDNQTGDVIAELDEKNSDIENGVYVYDWTGEALCAEKAPIVLELVDPADYADGGEDVVGNTEGDIWKITWNLKDGPLYRSDNYSLTYQVTVDTAEDDFEYDTWYPANGNTTVEYTDEEGEETVVDVEVPDVIVPSEKKDPPKKDKDKDRKPVVTIPDEQVPVAPAPEETVEEEVVEIPEEEVPMADVPKTGDISALWLALSALSGTGLAGVSVIGRRKRED